MNDNELTNMNGIAQCAWLPAVLMFESSATLRNVGAKLCICQLHFFVSSFRVRTFTDSKRGKEEEEGGIFRRHIG